MKPSDTPQVIVNKNGERSAFGVEEYVAEKGSRALVSVIARVNAQIATGTLRDEVRRNEHVVDRALQEDGVFYGKVVLPYWLAQDKMKGQTHIEGLVEDYSPKAWRVIATEADSFGSTWFSYTWAFLPKSQVTVTTVEGIESIEDAREFTSRSIKADAEARKAHDEAWEAAESWEEKLALVDPDGE